MYIGRYGSKKNILKICLRLAQCAAAVPEQIINGAVDDEEPGAGAILYVYKYSRL